MTHLRRIAVGRSQLVQFSFFGIPLTDLGCRLHTQFGVELGIYGSSANFLLQLTEIRSADLDLVLSGDHGDDAMQYLETLQPCKKKKIYENSQEIGYQLYWKTGDTQLSVAYYSAQPTGPLYDDVGHSLVVWLPSNRVASRAGDIGLAIQLANQKLLYYPPGHTPSKMVWRASIRILSGWSVIHPSPGERISLNIQHTNADTHYKVGTEMTRTFSEHRRDWSDNNTYYGIIQTLAHHLTESDQTIIMQSLPGSRQIDVNN